MTVSSVPVRYHRQRRGQLIQKLQHAVPSVMLLQDGFHRLTGELHVQSVALGVAELVSSGLVIGSMIRAIKRLRAADTHHAHGVDWIDTFLGAMLAVEALMHQQETGHLPRPTVLVAILTLGIGIFHARLSAWGDRRRALHVTGDGVSLPGRPFRYRRLFLPWSRVAAIDIDERSARVQSISGDERRFDLADAVHADALRAALTEAQARHRLCQDNAP
jgi:hypothetical protein